ncbi:hypothetical protein O0I10_001180 [Lichtheimia ornata]|uniref:non-specific serine/threonine protein kinase n=1 Tax=Lichtheimia ornata TaxID=688661 RepID=A0AAD8DIF1_9FUNG|nr:uncharacterized protein O0I10_001180 [Lichtheimia ornata]KAJ8663003.1 hypothetical protein O0I10_001180 [Lichtheimia ornata]
MGKTKSSLHSGQSVPQGPDPGNLLTPPGSAETMPTSNTSSGSLVRTPSSSRLSSKDFLSVRSKNSISKHNSKIKPHKSSNKKGSTSSATSASRFNIRSRSLPAPPHTREIANASTGTCSDDPDILATLVSQDPWIANKLVKENFSNSRNKRQHCVIGSHQDCDIRLQGLERKHCIIYPTFSYHKNDVALNLHLVDRSKNGTWVGKQVFKQGRTVLDEGSELIFKNSAGEDLYRFKVHIANVPRDKRTFDELYRDIDYTLGQGTFGQVKKVQDKDNPSDMYACKTINLEKFKDENTSLRMLYTEVCIQMELQKHPCVLKVERVLESRTELFIIMEYGKDGDLFEYLQKNQATEDEIRIIFDQIFHAVAFMHANKVVHRDLKLENVIVMNKDKLHVKLGDFGMSRFDPSGRGNFDTACGTMIYCAPERLYASDASGGRKLNYNKSVDVWSLGVMLYASLAHSMPFNVNDIDSPEGRRALENRIRTGRVSFHDAVWHRVSADAKDLILRMLETDHAKRPTMDEVISHRWLAPENIENDRTRLKGLYRCPELQSFNIQLASQPPSPSPSSSSSTIASHH